MSERDNSSRLPPLSFVITKYDQAVENFQTKRGLPATQRNDRFLRATAEYLASSSLIYSLTGTSIESLAEQYHMDIFPSGKFERVIQRFSEKPRQVAVPKDTKQFVRRETVGKNADEQHQIIQSASPNISSLRGISLNLASPRDYVELYCLHREQTGKPLFDLPEEDLGVIGYVGTSQYRCVVSIDEDGIFLTLLHPKATSFRAGLAPVLFPYPVIKYTDNFHQRFQTTMGKMGQDELPEE